MARPASVPTQEEAPMQEEPMQEEPMQEEPVYVYMTLRPCEHPAGVIHKEGVVITSTDGDLPESIYEKVG